MRNVELFSQNKKRGKVFVSWVALFFVMVLIAFLIMGIYFYSMNSTLQENLLSYNTEKTKQLSMEVDVSATRSVMSAVNLSNHSDLISGNLTHSYDARKNLIAEIAMQLELNRDISEICIYLPETNELISSNSIIESQYFYQSRFNTKLISYDEWEALLKNKKTDYFCLLPYNDTRKIGEYKLTYVLNTEKGKILVSLNQENLISGDSYFAKMMIADKDENLYSLYDRTGKKTNEKIEKLPENDGLVKEDKNNYISCISSTVPGFRYIIFTQKELLNKNLSHLQFVSVAYLLLFLVFGLILAWYFAFRQYKPLSRILETLKIVPEEKSSNKNNEYTQIESHITNILKEKAAISREARKKEKYAKGRAVANLLSGRTLSKDAMEILNLEHGVMSVVRIMCNENQLPLFENDFEMMQVALENVAQELFGEIATVYSTDMDGGTNLLLVFKSHTNTENIYKTAQLFTDTMMQKLQMETSVVFGKTTENISILPEIYAKILDASFRNKDYGNVILADEITKSEVQVYNYSVHTEMKIILFIKNGDYDGANEIISNEINDIREKNYSISLVRCFMVELATTIMKAAEEIRKVDVSEDLSIKGDIGRIFNASTINEMEIIVREYLKEVCEYAVNAKSCSTSGICDEIKKYIKENYSDSELNVNELAKTFYLNPTYLSSLFKKNTGVKLLEFINKVRVDKAKKLMVSNPDLSVEEVAFQTGFSSSRTFRRIFQKYEESAPSKFVKG